MCVLNVESIIPKPITEMHIPPSIVPNPVAFIDVYFANALASIEPITAKVAPTPIDQTLR